MKATRKQPADRPKLERLAEEFAERYRSGDNPSINEYAAMHPQLADEIRQLFPALVMLEEAGYRNSSLQADWAQASALGGKPLKQLGDYIILRAIGRGGMAVVYEAEHQQLGRRVALKVLLPHAASEVYLQRFRREARSAAKLHHTHIVPMFEAGDQDGVHFIAMQYIRGQSLEQLLQEIARIRRQCGRLSGVHAGELVSGLYSGQFRFPQREADCDHDGHHDGQGGDLPSAPAGAVERPAKAKNCQLATDHSTAADSSETNHGDTASDTQHSDIRADSEAQYYRSVARLGVQAAEALAYAHSQHVLHRDIKPSNLLLDWHGNIWVTDFGLAKTEDENLTHSGDIIGTLRYMAPERFRGECDPRSDVYGLGVTLYEMLTLRPAFDQSDRVQLIRQVTVDEPPKPRRLNHAIPADLDTIVCKAIAKHPADRYGSAAALADDLRCFLGNLPIRARNWSIMERTMRWCRRQPAVAMLTALAAILLVMTSITSIWLASALRTSQHHLRRATEAEHTAMRRSYDAAVAEGQARRLTGRAGQRFDSLKAISRAASLTDVLELGDEEILKLRNQAIASMALSDLRVAATWDIVGRQVPAVDVDFEHCFQHDGTDPGAISVRRVDDGEELFRLPGFGLAAWILRPSPDGRYLAAKYHDPNKRDLHLYVWDLRTRQPVLKLPDGVYYDGMDFSPDSRSIVVGPRDGSVRRYDLTTGRQTQALARAPSGYPAYAIRFQPGGKKLAVSSLERRTIEIRDPQTSEVLASYGCPSGVRGICWSHDGRLLAAACDDYQIYVWDTEAPDAAPRLKLAGHQLSVIDVAFNDRGDVLASYSWDETTRLWSIGTGRQLLATPGRLIQFSPDNRQAFFRRLSEVGIWSVDFANRRTLVGYAPAGEVRHVDIGPRGGLMATATTQGVQIWDLTFGREVAFLPIGDTRAAIFHPDGDKLFTSGLSDGLFEWPIVSAPDPAKMGARSADVIRIGPPRKLLAARRAGRASLDGDGRKMVIATSINTTVPSAVIMNLRQPAKQVVIGGQPDLETVAISPHGRWIATGTWRGSGVKVWDATNGQPVSDLVSDGDSRVAFSPDGNWLVTSTADAYQFWEVGTWRHGIRLATEAAARSRGPMAFTDDSSILAVALPPRLVRLVEAETGRELATLEPPFLENLIELRFSRDGSQLAVATHRHVHIWDLRQIRSQLSEMGLDWDQPPYPPAGKELTFRPLRVAVHLGELDSDD